MNQGVAAPCRFRMKYVVAPGGCWNWVGYAIQSGKLRYGRFRDEHGRLVMAHRWSFEHATGEKIAAGLDIDHLCRNTLCVNPAHLEPVTRRENILRGTSANAINAAKTHCLRGHALTKDNCYAKRWPRQRQCKLCARESARKNAEAVAAAIQEMG